MDKYVEELFSEWKDIINEKEFDELINELRELSFEVEAGEFIAIGVLNLMMY